MVLPRVPNITNVLAQYLAWDDRMASTSDVAEEIVEGIKDYFDGSLSSLLLYKSERAQYDDMAESTDRLSDVYGPEHLIRLFCQFGTVSKTPFTLYTMDHCP